MWSLQLRSLLGAGMLICVTTLGSEPREIPIGLDAYRQWDKWPCQRIGARAYMRSTYDRRGGNEGADASHFLYQAADDFNVTLDLAGPGVLYFARCNHWHGSPWHYEVDGTDHLVQETATADPVHAKARLQETVFIPEHLFPSPLTWTWSTTKGADLMWVPILFERTFRLADLMPFGRRALIRLEHGGENQSTEHYETVTYWYGLNRPTLVQTDELEIGDSTSEEAHRYVSPEASAPYEINSRYEWGVDTLPGPTAKEVYPPHDDIGRKTTGTSEFTLKLTPDNWGVVLRRKLDYAFPNQRAEVDVADLSRGEARERRRV